MLSRCDSGRGVRRAGLQGVGLVRLLGGTVAPALGIEGYASHFEPGERWDTSTLDGRRLL